MMDRLRARLAALVCRLKGHDYEPWSPYCRGHYDGPLWQFHSTLWMVEVGQQRRCRRCPDQQFRGVWFDEPAPMPESQPWD